MGSLSVPVTASVICRTCPGVNRPMPELRHLVSSRASLRRICCLSLLSLASAASRAAFASAARCLSASVRCLVPVSRGVAASPCAVSCAVCVCTCVSGAAQAPDGFPSEELLPAAASSTRCTCSSAGGALTPLLCELSIPLYCTSLSRSRRVSSPSYPCTLELRPRRTQLAWNAPGLASPSSLIETGDQSDLKRLTPAL
jgi:hypothetical protein